MPPAALSSIACRCLLALSLLAGSVLCPAATMYRWVDAQGVVHYSDTPHPGAEQIQLSGAQTYHNTPTGATTPSVASPPVPNATPYQSCAITQPGADAALYAPESVDVSVRLIPALRPGDLVSVQLDGSALQPLGGDALNFQIAQPDRGAHTISAEVRTADGTVVCSAAPVSFSVQRPSVNSPQSPVKPH